MSLTVTCLASGSSANAILVQCGDEAILVDAGLGMRRIQRDLIERGIAPKNLTAILVTHEHGDHSVGAVPFSVRHKVPIIATSGTLSALQQSDKREFPSITLSYGDEISLGAFGIQSIRTTHDAAEPCGFRVASTQQAMLYATDTGSVTPELKAATEGCQLLAIEANHDIHKLRFGPYPDALKDRILSRNGHLSNNAACDLILSHTDTFGPVAVWLGHLSEVNNTPGTVKNYWKRRWQEAGHRDSPAAVEIALRDTPSLIWRAGQRAIQRSLF
jgi:phosphoribosyl 1,2-cyclic phosphodiesterase